MSVLIKGVRLPSNCLHCPMQFGGFCYVKPDWVEDGRVASTVDEAYKQGRPTWCPLEELPSAQPTIEPDTDEWCETCKEYDAELHCCPRFNHVIKATVKEYEASMPIRCKDCKHYDGRPCGKVDWYNSADDYCSRGERKPDEE